MSLDGPVDGDVSVPAPSAPTEGLPEAFLAPGQVLGDRYQIRSQLGRGGMGEVWRAFDLKLRVEVALKAMRADLFKDERRRELLRREVRAAREVVSPNVCRIFDLIEADGIELVSMEYIDGATLLDVLRDRGPLDLKEAQDIASQFLAGLEAIHKAGLVHRDIKPENIMLTRAGRVVVMDFGLARQEDSGAGTVSGTPAYMAPEQAAGLKVDARADVYAAGVVLAEMVSPGGIKSFESRQSVWEGVHSEPAKLPDTPWAPVLKKAVAKEPDNRYNSAHTLTRALEDVTLRVEGSDDLTPYPGLASFTENDAEYFFGREAEVEQMWAKLERPHLLALIGPSGAGKSSFIRAGLIPNAGAGWAIATFNPGNAAFRSLRQELASELAGDAEAMQELVDVEDLDATVSAVSRWRRRHEQVLLVVDQFEELFTQNPVEVQARFTELLSRLVLEADVFVLLSMRDDFFFHCHQYEALKPVVTDLTLLGPPIGPALRRALVQPATKCGYRFEDDELVEEMLAEVEGERGALPLLAFAMSRLWEKRDRGNGLLTRQSYDDIGGVGGALAQHAEATIDRIGTDHIAMVRELFRNLITAEETRAIREWNELLSVFAEDQRSIAEKILRELIDARLLTSYEIREDEQAPLRRVEIIHESLLANWPRLVRWQTQDADGVQLRDQLRQAARTWDEHERSDDMLWTGSAYREFASWRECYPGGLTDTEEAFGTAMTALAGRRRRRRRIAVAGGFAVLLAGLAVVGAFWQRSVHEALRAEAQKLTALGWLEIEGSPSSTLAHAIAGLELADTEEARLLAMEALWKGPTAIIVNEENTENPVFSADGSRLLYSANGEVHIVGTDGSTFSLGGVHEGQRLASSISPDSRVVLTRNGSNRPTSGVTALWTTDEGKLLTKVRFERPVLWRGTAWNQDRALVLMLEENEGFVEALSFDGSHRRLSVLDVGFKDRRSERGLRAAMDRQTGRWLGVVIDNEVRVYEIGEHALSTPRFLGRHDGSEIELAFDPLGRYLVTANGEGELRLWDPSSTSPPRILEGPVGSLWGLRFTSDGSMFSVLFVEDDQLKLWMWSVAGGEPKLLRRFDLGEAGPAVWEEIDPVRGQLARVDWDRKIRLWPFDAPADAEPVLMGRDEPGQLWPPAFDSTGRWLATTSYDGLALYPLRRAYPSVMRHGVRAVFKVAFGPNGRWLVSAGGLDVVRLWPLEDKVPPAGRVVLRRCGALTGLAVSSDGQHLLVGNQKRAMKGDLLLSLDDDSLREFTGFRGQTSGVAFSPDGRLAAGAGGTFDEDENVIRIWDVASGEELAVLVPEADLHEWALHFTADNRLLSSGQDGLRRWNLETGESEVLYEGMVRDFSASADGRRVLLVNVADSWNSMAGRAVVLDLETGVATPLETHGSRASGVVLNKTGTIVATGDLDGVIRVGPVTGEEPHLLLGHESNVFSLAFDPLGRWIASGANDSTVRLWPMPDLSKPPLHTLPREELIAKLKTLTNIRVVRDEESSTGWKLTHDPFPGWETVPTW